MPHFDGAKLLSASTLEERADLTNSSDVQLGISCIRFTPHCTFSPDSKLVAVSGLCRRGNASLLNNWLPAKLNPFPRDWGGSVVRVWDVATAKEVMAFKDCIEAHFSPDGTVLATFHEGHTVKLWHLPFRKPLWCILGWSITFWLIAFVIYRLFGRAWRRSTAVGPSLSGTTKVATGPDKITG